MTTVDLEGCTPEPLASYLKALAVLRLVAEQTDAGAKGAWRDGHFVLESSLDRAALERFLLEEYAPTPIVGPWNGGSGFYEGDAREGLDKIVASTSARFDAYRRTLRAVFAFAELPPTSVPLGQILSRLESAAVERKGKAKADLESVVAEVRRALPAAREALHPLNPDDLPVEALDRSEPSDAAHRKALSDLGKAAKKARTALKKIARAAGKDAVVRRCRAVLEPAALEWLDAAVGLNADDVLSYPPLLGTAGSEGRLDYTNAFMDRVAALMLEGETSASGRGLLDHALFAAGATGLVIAPIGQHDPGRAGGYNQGAGIVAECPANPWDFIFALEGAVAWSSGVSRRLGARVAGVLSSPFTVRAVGVGYASASQEDAEAARAEIWAPLWDRPLGYAELRAFLAEGRADVGRRRAANAIDFAEAATSLGVDRGVREFVRYSLLKRRGDSYVALPAGRFPVEARTESDLARELDPPLRVLDQLLRLMKSVPAALASARRGIDEAIFELLLRGGARQVRSVLVAIGCAERLLARRDPAKDPKLRAPLRGLSPAWLVAADDGPEIRIAAALASIQATGDVGPIRANLAPLDPAKPWAFATGRAQTAWTGSALPQRLAGVLERRLVDAERLEAAANPVAGRIEIAPEDAAALIDGVLDERLLEDLLFASTWIAWERLDERSPAARETAGQLRSWRTRPQAPRPIPRDYALLKLVVAPAALERQGRADHVLRPPRPLVSLLLAGRVGEACELARRRLYASGFAPLDLSFPKTTDPQRGPRLAGALLVPIAPVSTLSRLVLGE